METHFKVACVQEQALYFIGNLAHDTENKAQLMDLLPLVRYCVCVPPREVLCHSIAATIEKDWWVCLLPSACPGAVVGNSSGTGIPAHGTRCAVFDQEQLAAACTASSDALMLLSRKLQQEHTHAHSAFLCARCLALPSS